MQIPVLLQKGRNGIVQKERKTSAKNLQVIIDAVVIVANCFEKITIKSLVRADGSERTRRYKVLLI
jgi:hypothetical protein